MNEIDYTIASTDEKHYNRIDTYLQGTTTRYAKCVVTSLTTNCNILVLNKSDYISINNQSYPFSDDYTDLNMTSFCTLLNDVIAKSGVTAFNDKAGRLVFTSTEMFTISSCSYNVMLLTGLYSTTFPVLAEFANESYSVTVNSVGYYLSTPVLYLLSNIGNRSYRPAGRSSFSMTGNDFNYLSSSRIVLRLNNSFSANYPIIVNNGEFETDVCTNDLTHLSFTLVDANMQEITLLNPMYVTVKITGVEDSVPLELWSIYGLQNSDKLRNEVLSGANSNT